MGIQQPLDGMDSRLVFRAYAVLAWTLGVFVLFWGRHWLSGDLNGHAFGIDALVRVAGAVIVGAACCATACAAIENPRDRRRALGWFALGHQPLFLVVLLLDRHYQAWGIGPVANWGLSVGFFVTWALLYAWLNGEGDARFDRWDGIVSLFSGRRPDLTERLRSDYEQQIREIAAQEERNRLARDLHDSIKQQIFVIQTAAATAEARFTGDADGARHAIEQVRDSAREAMTEMEALTDRLRATPLENAGLVEALKKQSEALGFRTGATVDVTIGRLPANEALPPGAQQAIFRAAQEALANVARHARATHVRVTLNSTADKMQLWVVDDGAGYDQEGTNQGMGIANMRARAEELGGDFEITSKPGGGTSVRFAVPYATATVEEFQKKALWAVPGLALGLLVVIIGKGPASISNPMAARASAPAAVLLIASALNLSRYLVAIWRARQFRERTV